MQIFVITAKPYYSKSLHKIDKYLSKILDFIQTLKQGFSTFFDDGTLKISGIICGTPEYIKNVKVV